MFVRFYFSRVLVGLDCLVLFFERIRGHRPRFARPPRMPHSLPRASSEREGLLRNPHSLPRASCARLFRSPSLKQAWTRSLVKVLRREGDSNPRNPFGVYTLSRRASSTTRASLLRRNRPSAVAPRNTNFVSLGELATIVAIFCLAAGFQGT